MMENGIRVILASSLLCIGAAFAGAAGPSVSVAPENCQIVLPDKADVNKRLAAEELRKHLQLVTGAPVAVVAKPAMVHGKYPFYVGIPLPGDRAPFAPFAPEEARWVVGSDATYLYGAERSYADQYAVYGLLEDQLGIRWIEPGDKGIAYTAQSPLKLTTGRSKWAPVMQGRTFRSRYTVGKKPRLWSGVEEYGDFLLTQEASDQRAKDTDRWLRRMRSMGGHSQVRYGHAFTDWWDKYGKTHPDYFALNKYGQREPERKHKPTTDNAAFTTRQKQYVKLCVSNPKVVEQIIQNWLATPNRPKWIRACENDGDQGFCTCAECRKLDAAPAAPGRADGIEAGSTAGAFGRQYTDRYIYLANAVAREARKHDPEACVSTYAYAQMARPPRIQKLEPNVLVGLCPTTLDLAKLRALFEGWKDAGATMMLVRPNLPWYYETTAMPMGIDRQMFDAFQLAWKNGCIVADYDSLFGLWAVHGMTDYILTRSFSDPAKPFEYWEDHYCCAYGAAAPEVKEYFRYWRTELFEKRFRPNYDKIIETGKVFNFARGVMWSLGEYYTPRDFDRTDAILKKAESRPLSETQKEHLRQLVLANRHARLTYEAVVSTGLPKLEKALALFEFRRQHKDDLRFASWLVLFDVEGRFGDVTAVKTAARFRDYPLPWISTALAWNFRMDPQNVGLNEKWPDLSREETRKWEQLRTDRFWEGPKYDAPAPAPSPETQANLRNYDGIGWYATSLDTPKNWPWRKTFQERRVLLYFGAVDESCWIYVNGKLAGKHIFEKDDDWRTSFEIEITSCLDWEKVMQQVVVRVEDKSGVGGIWRRVWLVSRER